MAGKEEWSVGKLANKHETTILLLLGLNIETTPRPQLQILVATATQNTRLAFNAKSKIPNIIFRGCTITRFERRLPK